MTQSQGEPPSPYRGEDRRRTAAAIEPPLGRPYLAAATLALLWWATITFAIPIDPTGRVDLRVVTLMLQAGAGLMGLAVAGLAIARWRLVGDAPALWVGIWALVAAVIRFGLVELWPTAMPRGMAPLVAAHLLPAVMIVGVAILVGVVTVPAVDTSLSTPLLAALATGGIAVLTLLFLLAPGLERLTGVLAGVSPIESVRGGNTLGAVPLLWVALAVLVTRRGAKTNHWLLCWFGLLLFCLALAELTRVVAPPPVEAGLIGRESVRLLGLVFAAYGATHQLLHTHRDVSVRLARSEYTVQSARAAAEERAHEARSALAAIEGATRTLEHYRDRLPPETQESLSQAIRGEIRRLQQLVSVEPEQAERAPFDLAAMVGPLATNERSRGTELTVRIPSNLLCQGRSGSTAEVVQTLLDNARRYAPGSAVEITAAREGDAVVLRVSDRGPGVLLEQRDTIFHRGGRGDAAVDVPGSGLGLYVAKRLMRDQGGRLWVEGRQDSGASFALSLPAAPSAPVDQVPVEDVEHAGQIRQVRPLAAGQRRH